MNGIFILEPRDQNQHEIAGSLVFETTMPHDVDPDLPAYVMYEQLNMKKCLHSVIEDGDKIETPMTVVASPAVKLLVGHMAIMADC